MIKLIDFLMAPVTLLAAIWLKLIRRYNVGLFRSRSSISKLIFEFVGVFPITDHYYEPYLGKFVEEKKRLLTGIDLKIEEQLFLLEKFNFNVELLALNNLPKSPLTFSFFKSSFATPPCIFKALIVATITTQLGFKFDFLHFISRNFSAPKSAPKPASVTT